MVVLSRVAEEWYGGHISTVDSPLMLLRSHTQTESCLRLEYPQVTVIWSTQ